MQRSFQGLATEVQLGFRSFVCGGRGLEVSACPGCCRSSRRLSCRRRSRLAAEVQLAAELQLAEEVLVRRGGPCWSAGCWRVLPADIRRRPRRSSSPRSLSLPRRFVLSVEVRLWPQRYGPACRGGSPTSGREGHDALDSSRWSCAAGCCMQHVQR